MFFQKCDQCPAGTYAPYCSTAAQCGTGSKKGYMPILVDDGTTVCANSKLVSHCDVYFTTNKTSLSDLVCQSCKSGYTKVLNSQGK